MTTTTNYTPETIAMYDAIEKANALMAQAYELVKQWAEGDEDGMPGIPQAPQWVMPDVTLGFGVTQPDGSELMHVSMGTNLCLKVKDKGDNGASILVCSPNYVTVTADGENAPSANYGSFNGELTEY